VVQLQDISLAYDAHQVLKSLNWQLLPGQVVGLLGRNGAGKTTLLETMLGLREAATGTVTLFDQPVQSLTDDNRARIGYVPQQSDLFQGFTPRQLLAYFRSFYPRWNEAKVDGLMSRWALPLDLPIGKLSGGQQQRLSIVRALAHEPDLLVLDEPVASLDPAGRRDFLRELVDQVLERGTTVIFSTHILSDLERVAFNVAFLSEGRISVQAPLDELLDQVKSISAPESVLQTWVSRHGADVLSKMKLDNGHARCLVRLNTPVHLMDASIEMASVNLEDLFMELTQ
jgi:ABC-2 type transport system ATP-binding protein